MRIVVALGMLAALSLLIWTGSLFVTVVPDAEEAFAGFQLFALNLGLGLALLTYGALRYYRVNPDFLLFRSIWAGRLAMWLVITGTIGALGSSFVG